MSGKTRLKLFVVFLAIPFVLVVAFMLGLIFSAALYDKVMGLGRRLLVWANDDWKEQGDKPEDIY